MNIANDTPRYDNSRPDTYLWHLVPNVEVRQWAKHIDETIENPRSMGHYAEWYVIVEGLRMSMRIMARYVEAVPFAEQLRDLESH